MNSPSQEELDGIYAFAVALGKDAGKLLMERVNLRINGGSADQMVEKDSAVDIVTKTDEGKLDLF
jgi:myo-inositol-1(or 4)-monophosphatase